MKYKVITVSLFSRRFNQVREVVPSLVKDLVGAGRAWSKTEKHSRQRKQHVLRLAGRRESGHGPLEELKGPVAQNN